MKYELMNEKEKELRQRLSAVRTKEAFTKIDHSGDKTIEEKEKIYQEVKDEVKKIKKEFANERLSQIGKGR